MFLTIVLISVKTIFLLSNIYIKKFIKEKKYNFDKQYIYYINFNFTSLMFLLPITSIFSICGMIITFVYFNTVMYSNIGNYQKPIII